MNEESTRLINEDTALIGQNKAENQKPTVENAESGSKKKSKGGRAVAAGIGGFVAGAAVGTATTAAATTSDEAIREEEQSEETANETIEVPEPEQVILANDEGIRYAHVDADNFNDAFAQAREQVGPGGVFEYNGRLYGTYLAEEWDSMSAQERADYQNRVSEIAPSHHSASNHNLASAENHEAEPGAISTNAEMIDPQPADNEIRVLGVETVEDNAGNVMNVALVECEGDQALLVDVDNNGTIDVLIHDDNGDGQLQESEFHDISDAQIEVADLMQAQAASEGDLLYASNDNMPDYVNDADSIMTV